MVRRPGGGRVILNMSDTAECVDYPLPDSGVLILTIRERETGNIRE